MTRALAALPLAASMLTTLRVPLRGEVGVEALRRSTGWYPLVGVAVGAVPAALLLLPLPPLPRAALALAGWVLVTGALHLDGWADCCDAAFAPARADTQETRQRRLAILKDPHLGTFGAAGLTLLLVGKWSALAHVPALAPLLAAPLARWGMVYLLRAHRPARPDGLGATFAGRLPLGWATLALALPALAVLWASGEPLRWAAAAALGVGAAVLLGRLLAARLGGVTGDVCGAAGEGAELVTLLALLPWGAA